MTDLEDLARRAAQGDARALDDLLGAHLPGLRRYVARRAGRTVLGREGGSDLVQSVCLDLLRGLRRRSFDYRGDDDFKRWLYSAALFKIRSRRRRWRTAARDVAREKPGLDDASRAVGTGPAAAASRTPSVEAARREEIERLRGAFDALPERDRQIIELAHFEGLSHKEIGERLSVSEGHSRVLLARALARLAEIQTRRQG